MGFAGIACLLLVFLVLWVLGQYLHSNRIAATFDPDYCLRITKWTALVCIALLTSEVLLLTLVSPHGSCASWSAALEIAGPMAIYVCLPAAVVPLIQTFRWQRFVQRTSE